MAQIEYNDSITTLIRDVDGLCTIMPGLAKEMLRAEADIVEPALLQALRDEGFVRTGRLLEDTKGRTERFSQSGGGYRIFLGPSGEHHTYVTRQGKANVLRSGHLGYVLEHGAPGRNIRGKQWMSKTIEKTQARALDAAEKVFDKYIKNNNL